MKILLRSTFSGFITILIIIYCHLVESKRSRKLDDKGCGSSDYHYEFTECDATGGRWRVAIPSNGCDTTPTIPPKRLDECYKSCDAGRFLNMTTMQCEECTPGTYSMGGGIRYEEWDPLPNGFEVSVEKFHSAFSPASRQYSAVDCSKWGWRARGEVLLSQGGPCVATLTLNTELVKSGNIKFTYQYSDDSVLFQFQANSDKCEYSEGSRWPALTGEGIWRTEEVPLRRGLNSIKFLTMGIDDHKPKPVMIRKIEIEGIGYASSCNACPSGTKSSGNAKSCIKCPVNTYSLHKSSQCFPCQKNYYSESGSRNCTLKPACTEADYYQLHTPCDKNNKTRIMYKWIEPRVCADDYENAVQLPLPGPSEECPPCNPGTEYRDKGCKPCPESYQSDGLSPCTKCPTTTIADKSHRLIQWYSWPYNMQIACISPEDKGCNQSPAWQLNGNYVSSGKGHADWVYLVLTLKVDGFRSIGGVIDGQQLEVGRLTFIFETKCSQECELLLMQSTSTKNATVIERWIGSNILQEATHIILRNGTYNFSWAFQKMAWDSTSNDDGGNSWSDSYWPRPVLEDENYVRIYSINVTNTIDGGASSCIECQNGFKSDNVQSTSSCLTCNPGYFRTTVPMYDNSRKSQLSNDSNSTNTKTITKCEKCPEDTVTLSNFATNASACKQCGPGLKSNDGLTCTTDCQVKIGGYSYDLSPLKGYHMVKGTSLFSASGTQYYHVYNISFCADGNARCDKNVSLPHGYDTQQNPFVEAFVCQSTIFPATSGLYLESNSENEYGASSPKPISTHAGSLGDHLIGISHSPSVLGIDVSHLLQEYMDYPQQFHFFYSTPEPTPACLRGRTTTITFRCQMPSTSWALNQNDEHHAALQEAEIKTPPNCPDATCDGCNFFFLWETPYACHLCSYEELTIVRGECKNGIQDIHYLSSPNPMCLLTFNESWPTTQKCSNHLPVLAEIAIQAAIGLTVLLSVLFVCFWRRHRKLEYKYMKLVASGASTSGGGSGAAESETNQKILPVPETCGIDPDDAEDEEEDHYSYNGHATPSMSGQMREIGFYNEASGFRNFVSKFTVLNKLKSLTRKGNETGSNMEIMNLTDKEAIS